MSARPPTGRCPVPCRAGPVAGDLGHDAAAADRRDRVEQRQQLSDVVVVAPNQQDRERGAVPIGDQTVLRAGPAPADR